MKRFLIILIFASLILNVHSQQFVPPIFIHEYCDLYDFYMEIENGVPVYRLKTDSSKISGDVYLSCPLNEPSYKGHEGEGRFVDGRRDGKWKLGRCITGVQQERNYDKGLITGNYKVFYELGYSKNGKWIKTGDSILYETNFVHGTGEWKDFEGDPYGGFAPRVTGYYKDGKKSGVWCYYLGENADFVYRKKYYEAGVLIKEEDFEIPAKYWGAPLTTE